jgi:hypothetical protein
MARIVSSLSLLAFVTFTTGCIDLGKFTNDESSAKDGADGTQGTEGTDGSDGSDGADGADGSDGADGGDDGGDDGGVEGPSAQVRFLNLSPGLVSFSLVDAAGEGAVLSQPLGAEQGSAYTDFPAGEVLLTLEMDGVVVLDGYALTLSETVPTTLFLNHTASSVGVHFDDTSAVGAGQTLLTAYNDADANAATLFYMAWNGAAYQVLANTSVGYTGTAEILVNTPADRDLFEIEWPTSYDKLLIGWEISDDMRAAEGSHLAVYFWTEGDCSYLSTTCVPRLVTQRPDGTVRSDTLAIGDYGWAG